MKWLWVCLILIPALSSPVLAELQQGKVHTPIADVSVTTSATEIDGQNNARTALSCTNTDGTIHVRWGSSAVTSTSGQQVRAGSSIEILGTDAVYMAAESGSVTVSCTKEVLR